MTAQEAFNMAVQKSNLNDPDLVPSTEWLDYLTSFERAVFIEAARENPDFFGREGDTSTRATSTASWNLASTPGNIASIQRAEIAAITGTVSGLAVGDEVNIVGIRNPNFALAPRIYIRNRTAFEYNEELQADSSNFVTRLKLYYSYLPTDKTSVSDNLEIPDEFILLVVLPLASLLAMRDQRPEEAALLEQQYQFERLKFLMQVSVYDEGTVRSLDQLQAASRRIEQ